MKYVFIVYNLSKIDLECDPVGIDRASDGIDLAREFCSSHGIDFDNGMENDLLRCVSCQRKGYNFSIRRIAVPKDLTKE